MKNHIVTLLILVAGYSFSMDAEQFFKTDDVKQFEMNSNGSLIATIKSMGQGQSIVLTNLYSLKTNIIYADNQIKNSNIEYIHWIDKDTLIVGISSNNLVAILVINLFFEQNEFKSTDQIFLPKYGYVKDPLIKEDNTFLFVALQPNNSDVQGLYKVNIKDKKFNFSKISKNIDSKLIISDAMVDPADGITKFLISYDIDKNEYGYWYLLNNSWKLLKSEAGDRTTKTYEELIFPQIIDEKNNELLVVTDRFNDKRSLVALNLQTMEFKRTIFEHDIYDVNDVIVNKNNGKLIGIFYFSNGQRKAHYFNQDSIPIVNELKNILKEDVYLIDESTNENTLLLYNNSIHKRATIFLYNKKNKQLTKLFRTAPWYNLSNSITVKPITTNSVDQMRIEGFLILPDTVTEQTPLMIFPHGGPWAVLDTIENSDLQLYFASKGIASLKINFRGSSGYGKKFLYAGIGEHGNKIEDDIQSLLLKTIDEYGFSKNKICAAGESYGGYSALMLGIRQPELIKCIISIAGPTDIPLNFTSSDFSYQPKLLKLAKELYGDPLTDLEKMIQRSPLYQVKKIKAPVLLIHGEKDQRVTLEHANRLKLALEKLNKPVSLIIYKNESHGFKNIENRIDEANRMIEFIQKSLEIKKPNPDI